VPFGVVGVQQPVRRPAVDLGGQLPAQVDRVLDAQVQPLPAGRRVDVRGVAGQQHPAGPVPFGQPGGVAEAGDPARRVHAEVGAGEHPQLLPDLVEGRRHRTVPGHPGGRHHDAVHPLTEGRDAEPQLRPADLGHHRGHRLRRCGHLHLAQQRLGAAGLAGERDAEQPAHRAAAAVAADQVPGPQPRAVGQFGGHRVAVLTQPGQRAAAPDLGAQVRGVLGQQAVGDGLRDGENVRVGGVQPLRRGLRDAGEPADRVLPAERQEPLQQPPPVQHLDAAHVQAERTHVRGRLALLLQHHRVHAVQPQLGGQHQAGRPAAGDDDVDHGNPPFADADDSAALPGPCHKPPEAIYVESGKEVVSSLPFFVFPSVAAG
jgi:hypothetical protein